VLVNVRETDDIERVGERAAKFGASMRNGRRRLEEYTGLMSRDRHCLHYLSPSRRSSGKLTPNKAYSLMPEGSRATRTSRGRRICSVSV
jgi:hypothetical protein